MKISDAPYPEIEYDGGYPTDECLDALRNHGCSPYWAGKFILTELPRAAENMPCFVRVELVKTDFHGEVTQKDNFHGEVTHVYFSTGGWSGAEGLLDAALNNFWINHLKLSWRRGGHYIFEVDKFALQPKSASAST